MKVDFLQPRFVGARFEEHTLPLEVARDLAAYETLIVELAKHLYLQAHPSRQRAPRGFSSEFQLHLDKIDEGSSRPLISMVAPGVLTIDGAAKWNVYFEQARDLVTECIASAEGKLPLRFPAHLLEHFNQIGRSLKEDETIEFSTKGIAANLTQERRKRLVLAASRLYEKEIELGGIITETDWEKSTFRLKSADGTSFVIPMPSSFHAQARECGGRPRRQVNLKGIGAFNSWDRLEKVISVESLEVQPDYQIAVRLDELAELKTGWHGEGSQALNPQALEILAKAIIGHYPENLPLPSIYPTPEGDLLLEWEHSGNPSLDINLATSKGYFHSFGAESSEIEREFPLGDDHEWKIFFEFLSQEVGLRYDS